MSDPVRPAGPRDRDLLVGMMREFYAETGTPCHEQRTRRKFGFVDHDFHLMSVKLGEEDGP